MGRAGGCQGRKRAKGDGSYLRSVNALEHEKDWDWKPATYRFDEKIEDNQGGAYQPREVQKNVLVRTKYRHYQERHEK